MIALSHAFKGCHLITEIYISEQISRIGAGAFGECWNLSSYLVDEENANYRCIDGLLCNKLGTELVSCPGAMSNISIPGTVIFIGDEAFYGCVNLISVSMPSNIRCIGQHAFCGCSRLGSITFKEGLTSIEYGAFMDCPLLTDVVLPSTVSKIGDDVFFNCSVRVYYRSSLPPLCGDNIYDERSANISYVPTSWNLTEELWQGMPWEYWNPLADDNKEVVGTIVYVAGDKVGFDTGLVGYAAKGLPSGLKLNKKTGVISGTPKKPGTYDVTFTKKGEETVTMTFVVDPFPTISIAMEGDTEKCKVTGASKPGKGYSVGKKVNLAAKAPKGTAFVGWFMDGEPWPDEATHLAAKQKYVMTGESLSLVARFEREKMSVSCPGLSSPLAVGSAVSIPIAIETQSGVKSVKGSKLPSGLKVKKVGDGWAIVGTPKKAGTYNAKVKVTAKSGAVEEVVISVVVE